MISDQLRREAVVMILEELDRAEAKFPDWPDDVIHASAVINEEAGELTQACLQYHYDGKPRSNMIKEASQVGAMAIRFLIEIMKGGGQ
jgi:hypothetical protein